jgi:hypothetical protein
MIDLSNLAEATEQQVFNQVKNHLLTQGKKSKSAGRACICLYKNEEGLKCAAGCLIADHQYMPEMEDNVWTDLVLQEIVPSAHSNLIRSLQTIHDSFEVEAWPMELREVAVKYNLQY